MRLTKDSVIPWGCVFKVTFPNGKIYVGSDTAMEASLDFFKYFGSPQKAREDMQRELGEYLSGDEPYMLSKAILFSQNDVRVGDVLKVEQAYIKALNAKDPQVGYNR